MSRSSGDFSCIAVDMGASSIRVMLGTLDSGYLTVEEVHRIPNGTIFRDRHERWDMDRILTEIVHGIGWAWKLSGGSAVSVGVDSWGVDFTLLDREGKPLEMPVAYRDQRTEGMRSEWSSIMPEMETFSRTGINFYPFNTLFQLLSIRGSEILSRSSSLLFLPCYINYLLTGKAINELTIASTSQMLKVDSVRWDPEIVGKLGLTEELLGKVTSPGTRLGKVVLPELKETMLEVVAVCAHDTACVVASIPALEHGSVYISTGTWCIVGIENDLPLISEEAFRNGFTSERGYGNGYRVLKNIVGLWLLQGLRQHLPEGTSYDEMERMAVESGEEYVIIDPEDPLFYNPADMKAAFDVYYNKTGQAPPGTMSGYIRSAYRSLCFSFRYHIEQLERLSGRKFGVIHLVGGGSRSGYLNQQVATISGREVVSGPVEGAVTGNILVQAIALGRLKDLAAGRETVARSFPLGRYMPEPDQKSVNRQYRNFLKFKEKK